MDLVYQVALVAETQNVTPPDLMRVSAALQKQALRDFGPIWEVSPTVDSFATLEDVPVGYWPILVQDNIHTPGAAGIHLDKDGQPFALVQYSRSWSLTASHECLEMLADPFGNRLVAGQSPKPDQGRVEFLVEVCDPSEDAKFSYTVNGIMVSDFYTPHYFDPTQATGVRYSFTGAITEPRTVLEGGYLSWHDPTTDHWWQETYFGSSPTFKDWGVQQRNGRSLREMIDGLTVVPPLVEGVPADHPQLKTAISRGEQAQAATRSKAAAWRVQIEALLAGS
jgi:hypothetical protein